jgi:hypothetical protein
MSQTEVERLHQAFTEKQETVAKHQKELQELFTKLLAAKFQDLFEACVGAVDVTITQYTNYWNDGDECFFRIREFDVFCHEAADAKNPQVNTKIDDLEEFVRRSHSDSMEECFGDHTKIIVNFSEDEAGKGHVDFTLEAYGDHD